MAYLIGALFFLAVWVLLMAALPGSRRSMLWAGLAWGHIGPLSEYWHLRDYWHPASILPIQLGSLRFGPEDYVFAFSFAGICIGLFDALARRRGEAPLDRFPPVNILIVVGIGFAVLGVVGFLSRLRVNSLHAVTVAFLIPALFFMWRCPGWRVPALLTAIIVSALMWLFYRWFFFPLFPEVFEAWWQTEHLSGLMVWGVPVEEVLWAGITALFLGPAFRYCMERG